MSCLQDLGGGRLQAFMRIRDDQLHALEAALHEAAQELHPEHHRLAVADRQADDFPSATGVGGHCYCGRNADCSPALAYLEAGGAKPEIGPLALQRPLKERCHLFVVRREIDPPDRFLIARSPLADAAPG